MIIKFNGIAAYNFMFQLNNLRIIVLSKKRKDEEEEEEKDKTYVSMHLIHSSSHTSSISSNLYFYLLTKNL